MKHLLTSTALVVALAACAQPIGMHTVGQPMVNDDGHSWSRFVSAGECADPQCAADQVTATGVEYTHYVMRGGQWVWTTEPVTLRPVTAPALGYAIAGLVVPPLIEGGATVGAGVLVNSGLQHSAEINALGNVAAAQANAKGEAALGTGIAAQKPPTSITTNNNVVGAYSGSTSGAAVSANASANAAASQSQNQNQSQMQTGPTQSQFIQFGDTKN